MSITESLKFEKEVEQIEAELGEDHLVRMLQYLTSDSHEASQGLIELHTQCREVISKYPPTKTRDEKKKTDSPETTNYDDEAQTVMDFVECSEDHGCLKLMLSIISSPFLP
uniref:GAT domain-containing protein n=1 Tax=Angiostrongylus cantonensis TaxID=6313 RepID=A0A0K0DKK9_ANGCA